MNLIPDYLSLWEMRWPLGRFEKVRSVPGQITVLLADALITGAIIRVGVNETLWKPRA